MSTVEYCPSLERWHGDQVPAECDYAGCHEEIYRGYEFLGDDVSNANYSLFFCYEHQAYSHDFSAIDPKPDTMAWLMYLLTSPRTRDFRDRYPEMAKRYEQIIEEC